MNCFWSVFVLIVRRIWTHLIFDLDIWWSVIDSANGNIIGVFHYIKIWENPSNLCGDMIVHAPKGLDMNRYMNIISLS